MQESYDTAEQFVHDLTRERLARRQSWIYFNGTVAGARVELKTWSYTYLKVFRVDGQNKTLSPMDCTATLWATTILKGLPQTILT